MRKGHYSLVLAAIGLTILATAGSLCRAGNGPCEMSCCAPGPEGGLVVVASTCCRLEAAKPFSDVEAVRIQPPRDAAGASSDFVAQGCSCIAADDARIARTDLERLILDHRDPVPTYLLDCSILR